MTVCVVSSTAKATVAQGSTSGTPKNKLQYNAAANMLAKLSLRCPADGAFFSHSRRVAMLVSSTCHEVAYVPFIMVSCPVHSHDALPRVHSID